MEKMPDSDREFLDRLFEAFGEAASQDDHLLRASLHDEGIDPDDVVRRGLQMIRNLSRQQRLLAARAQFERVRDVVRGLGGAARVFSGDVRTALAEALAGPGRTTAIQAYFRKLESVEPEDLMSLVDDAKILEFLEHLEQGAE
jgi:hypothetical protein